MKGLAAYSTSNDLQELPSKLDAAELQRKGSQTSPHTYTSSGPAAAAAEQTLLELINKHTFF